MKNKSFYFKLFFISIICLFISSCVSSGWEDIEEEEEKAKNDFNNHVSLEHKKIIKDFFYGKLEYDFGHNFSEIKGGFYCLWKQRDVEIYPYPGLNKLFSNAGFNVTNHSNKLNFIIVSQTVSHNVGSYSNGGQANQIETKISVIDLKKKCVYTLENIMGSRPPSTVSKRNGDNSGSIGSVATETDIFNLIKRELKFSK
jgi:hypothetical protein